MEWEQSNRKPSCYRAEIPGSSDLVVPPGIDDATQFKWRVIAIVLEWQIGKKQNNRIMPR